MSTPQGSYRTIRLSNGLDAMVDDDMYDALSKMRWHFMSHGKYAYRQDRVKGKRRSVFMHRMVVGEVPRGKVVDHINGNSLDNRRCNLRICTQAQNTANQKRKSRATCKYRGVCVINGKRIRAHIQKKVIGYYKTLEDAARAYDAHARVIFGEYARLNFPNEVQPVPGPKVCQIHRWAGGPACKTCGEPPPPGYKMRKRVTL